jgi:hypothetical protein
MQAMRKELRPCNSRLSSMKPSFLNVFRKKLLRERVVPILSAGGH